MLLLMMYFCCVRVSAAELVSHPELDPDSDGSFTEADAQVNVNVAFL